MTDKLRVLVKADDHSRKIAVLDESKLAEYYVETEAEGTLVNAVFVGRVERVLPDMKAAFVKIGQPINGFLPLRELDSFHELSGDKPLVSGMEIVVQVKKDARDQKGSFLTRDVSLPGQYLIFMPLNRFVGVSKRVNDERDRDTLLALGQELSQGAFGLIMRNNAMHARYEELLEELQELTSLWREISDKATYAKAPALLHQDGSVLTTLSRDYAARYELSVTCNDAVSRMPSPPIGLMWEQVSAMELDAQWTAVNVDSQLAEALERKVVIKNGGTLVIDEREALSTVDVNSGRFVASGDDDLALKQNLAACPAIAQQIRLRNLSGIILIDFIDMRNDAQRQQVSNRLRDELSRERDKTVIHGFTSLGLLEMTRKRTGATLREVLQNPCLNCKGTGYR